MDIESLVTDYKPVFVFSKEEKYYPCSAEYIISHSQLYSDDTMIYDYGEVTDTILGSNVGNSLKINPESYRGQIETAPVYYFTRQSDYFIDIVFFLYFTYNGAFNVLGISVGDHEADIEHVTLRLDLVTRQVIAIYYSAHSDEGRWIDKKDIKFIDKRPIVYVAKYSHAMYHTEGRQWRIMGFANDKTDFGFAWNDYDLTGVEEDSPRWMSYTGKWSRDGVNSVIVKDWWLTQPTKNSNWLTRMLPLNCITNRFMDSVDFKAARRIIVKTKNNK